MPDSSGKNIPIGARIAVLTISAFGSIFGTSGHDGPPDPPRPTPSAKKPKSVMPEQNISELLEMPKEKAREVAKDKMDNLERSLESLESNVQDLLEGNKTDFKSVKEKINGGSTSVMVKVRYGEAGTKALEDVRKFLKDHEQMLGIDNAYIKKSSYIGKTKITDVTKNPNSNMPSTHIHEATKSLSENPPNYKGAQEKLAKMKPFIDDLSNLVENHSGIFPQLGDYKENMEKIKSDFTAAEKLLKALEERERAPVAPQKEMQGKGR